MDVDSHSKQILVKSHNGKYSLVANEVTLSEILHQLAETASIRIKIFEHLGHEKQDWMIEQMPLKQLLTDILWNYSTVFIYEEGRGDRAINQEHRIKELWLIERVETSKSERYSNIEVDVTSQRSDENGLTPEQKRELRYIDGLMGLTSDDVIQSLQEILKTAKDPIIRKRAVEALADIGGIRILDVLESALGDRAVEVRTEIAKTFADIDHQRSLLALGQLLFGDENAQVREAAVRSLYKLKTLPARSFVESALNDKNNDVMIISQELLSRWDNAEQ